MKVFRLRNDVDRCQYFLPENEADWPKLQGDCTPKARNWSPPPVYVYKPRHEAGDFYQFGSGVLITSPRATEALRTHLEMAGELLALPHAGREYTVLNVTECINCLDETASVWSRNPSTGERVRLIDYAFHRDRFSESAIFKIPETCRAEILLVEGLQDPEDELRQAVERAQLRGLIFESLWSDEG